MSLGDHYFKQGLFDEAVLVYDKAMELSENGYGLGWLGGAYAKSGRTIEARAVLERLQERSLTSYVDPVEKVYVYVGLGDADRSFEWLEKAYGARSSDLAHLRTWVQFQDLTDARQFPDSPTWHAASDSSKYP